jgi:hypothetical protein
MQSPSHRNAALGAAVLVLSAAAPFAACDDAYRPPRASGGASGNPSGPGAGGGLMLYDGAACTTLCSNDLKNVIDCRGVVLGTCTPDQGCVNGVCLDDPCKAAELSKSSYGCSFWALKTAQRPEADGACFAAFVANTWGKPIHLEVSYAGQALDPSTFAGIPVGQGKQLFYQPYNPALGLGVGEVLVLFLSRSSKGATVVNCPIPAAVNGIGGETGVAGTGLGSAFHITSDYPVVAYQMTPYGGGQAAFTSATLLLPTASWDTNYVAINAYASSEPNGYAGGLPSLDIVASQDSTVVTILPKADIVGGPGVTPAAAGTTATYSLNAGQFLQITQTAELTGSPIQANLPIGVFGASAGMAVPLGQTDIDSAQQQIPPVRAMGNEYVAVRYRGRGGGKDESVPWRIVGLVDGTTLTWEPVVPPGAPKSVALGQVVELNAPGPFVVKSQDGAHPFYLGAYMTGGGAFNGEGDPDWVNVVPPAQYLDHYVLFTDPTYPETNLVLVRTRSRVDSTFADVTLQCAGGPSPRTVTGWQPIGAYEYARVDLSTGNFASVNGCSNGRQDISSALPFGVTVWGWGNTLDTQLVSYAYPAGAGFLPINTVVVPTTK